MSANIGQNINNFLSLFGVNVFHMLICQTFNQNPTLPFNVNLENIQQTLGIFVHFLLSKHYIQAI